MLRLRRGPLAVTLVGALLLPGSAFAEPRPTEALRPVRVVPHESFSFMGVSWAASAPGWLLTRMEGEVYRLGDRSARPDRILAREQAAGRPLLFSALAAAANHERMIVADVTNSHLVEADVATGRPLRATFLKGVFPGAGVAWNGSAWAIGGSFDGDVGVQLREPRDLKVIARFVLPEEERRRLRRISLEGAIASSDQGNVLVSFYGLRRAIVLDRGGHETMSLALPIPDDRYVADARRASVPTTTEDVLALWRGRVTPMAAGFTDGDPSVLLQAPDEPRSVVWCRFSGRDGRMVRIYSLDIPMEPRSSFKAAARSEARGTTLMVLRTWKAGEAWRSSLYEYFVPR